MSSPARPPGAPRHHPNLHPNLHPNPNPNLRCYTDSDSCATASGTAGSFESKHVECVRNVPPPPPMPPSSPPPMPSPPPPPSPPPAPWAENRAGWGGPSDCLCSGYNSSLGFGAHCAGWEFEGQTPWCYVASSCGTVASTGSFGQAFFTCTKKPSGLSALMGRRLRAVAAPAEKKLVKEQDKAAKKDKAVKKMVAEKEPTPLSKMVEEATGKKVTSKAGGKVLAGLLTACYSLPATHCPVLTACYSLPATHCPLPAARCLLLAAGGLLLAACCLPRTTDS